MIEYSVLKVLFEKKELKFIKLSFKYVQSFIYKSDNTDSLSLLGGNIV